MRPAHGTIQRAAGFTLIELLIVIAISAILVALAVPSFQQAQARARASAWSSDLQSAFILAMSEAARYNRVAVVCRSATAAADAPACTDAAVAGFASNDWAAGWVVFVKLGGANATAFEAGDRVVARQVPPEGAGTVRTLVASNAVQQLTAFRPDGSVAAAPPGGMVFSIDHRDPVAAATPALRCVATTAFGRPRAYGPTLGAC